MTMPVARGVLQMIMARVTRLNQVKNGLVYLQITRGVAKRDHKWTKPLKPSLVVTAKSTAPVSKTASAVKVITVPDERWDRRDIKTIQLLPNCMAKQKAYQAGVYEAVMIDPDGTITEGSSSNMWIVTKKGAIITRPATHKILNGITRRTVHAVAKQMQLTVEERAFTKQEALDASEAFLTSASSHVTPIGQIDDSPVGGGAVGAVAKRLRAAYIDHVTKNA